MAVTTASVLYGGDNRFHFKLQQAVTAAQTKIQKPWDLRGNTHVNAYVFVAILAQGIPRRD
jgi:hypothetical protein